MKPQIPKRYQSLYKETARLRVMSVLWRFPEREFSLSDLAREAKVAKANIREILEKLHDIGFIQITKLATLWRIKANQQNGYFIKGKIVHNLDVIYESGLVEFLNDYYKNPKSIILFGSFRNGQDISTSDIDIAIEMDELKEYTITGLRELSETEKQMSRKIQLHLFNRKNIENHLFNSIANGIVLLGFLEVKS